MLSHIPPVHASVFAEHMTLAFRPSDLVEKALMARLGERVKLLVTGYAKDGKGQAAVVTSPNVKKADSGSEHITISCASGTNPVYSKTLVSSGSIISIPPFEISGVIARFTNRGWET